MSIQTRAYKVETLATKSSFPVGATMSISVEHTGSSGVVTMTNIDVAGNNQVIRILAGGKFPINPSDMPNAPIVVATDDFSTAQIVYWEA